MTLRRILMTADTVSGVWTHALELARGLSAAGIEVMLVVIGPEPSPAQRAEAIGIPGLVLIVPGLRLAGQDRSGPWNAADRERLRGLAGAFEADIVHCNGFREAAAGFPAPVVVVAHPCVRSWWRARRGEQLPPHRQADATEVRSGLDAASLLIAPTAAHLREFSAAWGAQPHTRVIHNGMDLPGADRFGRREAVLAASCVRHQARSLAATAADLPWPVWVAGEPADGRLTGPLRWLGRLDRAELLRVMGEAAIFAAPAQLEPSGLSILEAAKSGCALVLSDLEGMVELWGDAARFVPPGDSEALRRTLQELADDRPTLREFQMAARDRAQRFSRSAMVSGYLRAYRSLSPSAAPRVRAA